VTAARGFVRDALRGRPQELVDAVELMACELATNSVRHAGTDFELAIEDSQGEIRVEVSDAGQGRPRLRSPTPEDASGRGLRIVEALSDAWGVVSDTGATSVWFTLSSELGASTEQSGSALADVQRGRPAGLDREPARSARRARRRSSPSAFSATASASRLASDPRA
jgi:anti-sigma regulatory factor (Ser/Thr protein kinase)